MNNLSFKRAHNMQYSASYSDSLFLALRSRTRRKPHYLRLSLSLPLGFLSQVSPRLFHLRRSRLFHRSRSWRCHRSRRGATPNASIKPRHQPPTSSCIQLKPASKSIASKFDLRIFAEAKCEPCVHPRFAAKVDAFVSAWSGGVQPADVIVVVVEVEMD